MNIDLLSLLNVYFGCIVIFSPFSLFYRGRGCVSPASLSGRMRDAFYLDFQFFLIIRAVNWIKFSFHFRLIHLSLLSLLFLKIRFSIYDLLRVTVAVFLLLSRLGRISDYRCLWLLFINLIIVIMTIVVVIIIIITFAFGFPLSF